MVEAEKLNTARLWVIEHYDDLEKESFEVVKFDTMKDGSLRYPGWKAITPDELNKLCGSPVAA